MSVLHGGSVWQDSGLNFQNKLHYVFSVIYFEIFKSFEILERRVFTVSLDRT